MVLMKEYFESEDVDVEDRISGEFITELQKSDVDVEIVDIMGDLLHEDDFGGPEKIVEQIEGELLDDGN